MNIMIPILLTIMNLQTLILKFQTLQVTIQQLVIELNKPETEENSMNLNTGDTLIIVINDQNSNNKEINNKIVPSEI